MLNALRSAFRKLEGLAQIEITGPLILLIMLLAISAAIKGVAFQVQTLAFELAPDLALWALGIVFSVAATARTYFGGQLVYRVTRDPGGRAMRVDYDVSLPEQIEAGPRHLYMLMYTVTVWILVIVFDSDATRRFVASVTVDWVAQAMNFGCLFLSATAIGLALATLKQGMR